MHRQIAPLVIVTISLVAGGGRLVAQDSTDAARPPITARVHGRLAASRGRTPPPAGADAYLWVDTPELRSLFTSACTAARTSEPSWMGARTELVAPTGMALDSAATADLGTLRTLVGEPHVATHIDSAGAFVFDGVPAGDYWMEVESTQGASIVQWWQRVSYAPADLAVARLMGARGSDPLAVDLTERDMAPGEFCIDSVASSRAATTETSYRILPSGSTKRGADTPPIPLDPLEFSAIPSSIENRHVTTEIEASFMVLADGTVDLSSVEVSGGASSDVASAIRAAVRRLKFQPARRNGKAVAEPVRIVIGISST